MQSPCKDLFLTSEEVKYIDKTTSEKFNIPEIDLMETAAITCIKHINEDNILIVAGCGNNGGDGLALGRLLNNIGKKVKVYILGDIAKGSECFKINYNLLLENKIETYLIDNKGVNLEKELQNNNPLIIDCLYGIGLKGKVRPDGETLINIINKYKTKLISIDIPSGMECNTANTNGCCIKADITITFVAKKKAFSFEKSIPFTGKVVVEDIGVPKEVMDSL